MNINKIGIYNAKPINFGKNIKPEKETNTKDTNNKKDGLAMSALALTGMLYMAYKNRKLNADVDALKKQIFSEKNNIPEEVKETVQKIEEELPAADIIVTEEPVVIMVQEEEPEKTEDTVDTVEITETPVQKSEIQDKEDSEDMSFENFQNQGGSLHNGKAYMNYKLYSGDIVLKTDDKKIKMNYENGELKSTVTSVKNSNGEYDPKTKRVYITNENGRKTVEVYERDFSCRKSEEGPLFYEKWKKSKIIKIDSSRISIQKLTHFNDYLGAYFRQQKDGTWKGYYETREYNYKARGYDVISRDVYTGKKLSGREVKKMMA